MELTLAFQAGELINSFRIGTCVSCSHIRFLVRRAGVGLLTPLATDWAGLPLSGGLQGFRTAFLLRAELSVQVDLLGQNTHRFSPFLMFF